MKKNNKERKSKYILLSKAYGFGSPVVRGTNLKCQTLKSMHKAGDPVKMLAALYDLSEKQVKAAIRCKWKPLPIKQVMKYHQISTK